MRKTVASPTKAQQTLLLDKNGFILQSCDSLFVTHTLQTKPITQHLPFLDSIFLCFQALSVDNFPIQFPRVEVGVAFLPGIYDFQFDKIILSGQEYLRWTIYDFTNTYEALRQEQQKHHEQYIA